MDEERGVDASQSWPVAQTTVDSDGQRRPARLGEEREREILRAAYELLGEVGYEGLRLDAVALRARASKATLYRHWSGKPQLIAAAVRTCKAHAKDIPDTGSLRGDLVALLQNMAESMAGEDGPQLAGLVMAMRSDHEFALEMRGMFRSKNVPCGVIVSRAVDRGELDPDCNPNLIDEIAPAQLFMHSFGRGESLDAPYIDHLIDDILLPLLTCEKAKPTAPAER
jgi:AcrR family transcriptional regulator